jgi:hypothetical protein
LKFDQRRRQRVSLRRSHLQHPRRIETLSLERELSQLYFREERIQGNRRPLQGKPSLPAQQVANVGQRWASCILLERIPPRLPRLRTRLRQEGVNRALAFRADRIGDAPVQGTVHLRPAALCFFAQGSESRQLEAAADQLLDGYVNNVGQIFHPGRRRQPDRC